MLDAHSNQYDFVLTCIPGNKFINIYFKYEFNIYIYSANNSGPPSRQNTPPPRQNTPPPLSSESGFSTPPLVQQERHEESVPSQGGLLNLSPTLNDDFLRMFQASVRASEEASFAARSASASAERAADAIQYLTSRNLTDVSNVVISASHPPSIDTSASAPSDIARDDDVGGGEPVADVVSGKKSKSKKGKE
jgi:hypothetical protein